MGRLKRINTKERRASSRVRAYEVLPHAITRLATGQEAGLINIGLNGSMLVRTRSILAPGSVVRLTLEISGKPLCLEGRVQRSRVIGLGLGEIRYEAALLLNDGLPPLLAELVQAAEARKAQAEQFPVPDSMKDAAALPSTAEIVVLEA